MQRNREAALEREAREHPGPVKVLMKDGQPVEQMDLFSLPDPDELELPPRRISPWGTKT